MAKAPLTPDRLFDRMWRPGRPFHARISRLRRIAIGMIFGLLCIVIAGYVYITDETRVKQMAESYLGTLVGGPVKIGRAKLSIFQGLQLEDVELYSASPKQPGSLLFSAHSFLLEYSVRALLVGNIEATRIIAVEPQVHVSQDVDSGKSNFSKLLAHNGPSSAPSIRGGKPIRLPEVMLRNAEVVYQQMRNGQVLTSNSIGVEGHLTPTPDSRTYSFSFQSRGEGADVGPMVSGEVSMDTSQVTAQLANFEFDEDVKAMLPPEVHEWCQEHGLAGRVNIPQLSFTPPANESQRARYHVELELGGVTIAVPPADWMPQQQKAQLENLHDDLDVLRQSGLVASAFANTVGDLLEPQPFSLSQAHGRFIFSDDKSITIQDLRGWLQEIPFKIDGVIKDHTPAAAAHLRIASSDQQDVQIPPSPPYLNSMPPAVRELYDRFRPRGKCRFAMDIDRPTAGAKFKLNGNIDILDGHFVFERFPYPLDHVVGSILLGTDPKTGEDLLTIDHLAGHGMDGGANAEANLSLEGTMSPLGPDTHVDIVAKGDGLRGDSQLIQSFPPLTREAIGNFSGLQPNTIPDFNGGFVCHIIRERGMESHWTINTDVHLAHAAGRFRGFPYPIDDLVGDLNVRDDHVDLVGFTLHHGTTDGKLEGVVRWTTSEQQATGAKPGVWEKLSLIANHVAIDDALVKALPASKRGWLSQLGLTGKLDVTGKIDGPTENNDVGLNLDLKLSNGTLWPVNGVAQLVDASGDFQLTDDKLAINSAQGRRLHSWIYATGDVSWPNDTPQIALDAHAKALSLDPDLYVLLPSEAKSGWDQIRPEGTADVSLQYSGKLGGAEAPAGLELSLTPVDLNATPAAAPYRMEHVIGALKVSNRHVDFSNVTAHHGDAQITLSGSGDLDQPGKPSAWQFSLGVSNALVDDDLRAAIPATLAEFSKSLKLQGKLDFDFPNLVVRAAAPTSRPGAAADPDVDFAVSVKTPGLTMDVGLPLENVKGSATVTGTARKGSLATLSGPVNLDSLTIGGRPITQFHADLLKSEDRPQLTIGRMQAAMAKGSLAGQVDYAFPDRGPSKYYVNLVLQNADVKELTGEAEQQISGQLSASLTLEGSSNHINTRRGRGDLTVAGQQMFKIPVLFGLLQVANLALPINSPFTEASVRYGIEGNHVTFEDIALRSKDMAMQGSGNLDFGSKQVRLTFVTDNPTWAAVPLLGPMIEGARHELLQIHVKGTIQEPKVSAGSLYTLTTTIDQVVNSQNGSGAMLKKTPK